MRLSISHLAIAAALLLTACPAPAPNQGQAVQQAPAPAAQPAAATAVAPPADAAAVPQPTAAPPFGDPKNEGVSALPTLTTTGSTVELSGIIAYAGSQTGAIRIDVLQKDSSLDNSERYEVVHAIDVEALGAWSLKLPADLGEVKLIGFIEVDGNGPGPTEPGAEIPGLKVGAEAIPNIAIQLVDGGISPPKEAG